MCCGYLALIAQPQQTNKKGTQKSLGPFLYGFVLARSTRKASDRDAGFRTTDGCII